MNRDDLRLLVEPYLKKKRIPWDDVVNVQFWAAHFEVEFFIKDFAGNYLLVDERDIFSDLITGIAEFKYGGTYGLVEDQSLQEQSGEEASGGRGPSHRGDGAPGDGDSPGSTREGPGDGREAQAGPEAPSEEAEAGEARRGYGDFFREAFTHPLYRGNNFA